MITSDALLQLRDVTVTFDGIAAVDCLTMTVHAGEIAAIIGPNGAGKTTALNAISGFAPARGSIRMRDIELLRLPASRRAALGIGRTFQNLALFGQMTVLDNVLVGMHARLRPNIVMDILRFPVVRSEERARHVARAVLAQLGIESYAEHRASMLPFGIQKLVGVARALTMQPSLLLLDEPAAGLNRAEVDVLMAHLRALRDELGVAMVLVEHNMRLVMGISDQAVVLDEGRCLAAAEPAAVAANPAVIAAYLGGGADPVITAEVRDELARGQ